MQTNLGEVCSEDLNVIEVTPGQI